MAQKVSCVWLGTRDYLDTWRGMRRWADRPDGPEPDEWWFLEHPPIYTLGQGGDRSGLLDPGEIPVVHSDRGGNVTFHGPGQLVFYPLTDLSRRGLGVRRLVALLEQSVMDVLADYGVLGTRRVGAPGVYVEDRKIASLGIRVRRGRCYHGLSLNVCPVLEPFERIHPCGYEHLEMTRMCDLTSGDLTPRRVAPGLAECFGALMGLTPDWQLTTGEALREP